MSRAYFLIFTEVLSLLWDWSLFRFFNKFICHLSYVWKDSVFFPLRYKYSRISVLWTINNAIIESKYKYCLNRLVGLWCLTLLSTIFQLYHNYCLNIHVLWLKSVVLESNCIVKNKEMIEDTKRTNRSCKSKDRHYK